MTFRGGELEQLAGWAVIVRNPGGKRWIVLYHTFGYTRRSAIARFDSIWQAPGQYRRDRRRGIALAVRCELRPMPLPAGGAS